ncbi:MAG: hemolysin family protein [Anaerolineae bacterium]|nr:hemolysin family protein [Anaerolineae bacterium]
MEPGSIFGLFGLIALHAFITLAYAALTNSRQPYLREQTENGLDVPPQLHITYQMSLLLVRFGIAAVAVTGLGEPLSLRLTESLQDAGLAGVLAGIIVLLPTAMLTLILGDLVPEAIGSTRADGLAPWAIYPMRLLIGFLNPVVVVMIALSQRLAGIFGSSDKVNIVTEEELLTMLDASEKEGSIENEEKEMIYSVLEFGDKLVREVMVPRIDIVALDIETTLNEALGVFMESGHSRIPVYEDDIDHVKGLLYAKDLLNLIRQNEAGTRPIRDLMRSAFFVPESKRADLLLKELRFKKIHIALVVDEYGGIAGLVTIEDLIEEIIGDIQDEFDLHEEADFVQQGPNAYLVDAGMSLSDFNDLLDVELDNENSNTVGGFLFNELGRVPEVGETVEHSNMTLRVDSIDGRRIRKVHVTRKAASLVNQSDAANHTRPQPQTVTE